MSIESSNLIKVAAIQMSCLPHDRETNVRAQTNNNEERLFYYVTS